MKRLERTEKAELVSVGASVVMAAAMIVVAMISHSVSILAEGTDSILDVVASLTVLFGIRVSRRHTRTFPQGLYKLENLVATAIGLLILYSAYELAREAIQRLVKKGPAIEGPWLVIGVMAGVVVSTGLIAWYKAKVGKEENSPSLIADGRQSWADAVASVAVIVGVGLEAAGVAHADSIAALVVVFFLALAGIGVVKDGLKVLLDASIESDLLEKARRCAESVQGVREVLEVKGRNSGSFRFLSVELVSESADLREAERVSEKVSAAIKSAIANIDNVAIQLVPRGREGIAVGLALSGEGEALAEDLGGAPELRVAVVSAPSGEVLSRQDLPNPAKGKTEGKDIYAAVALAEHGIDAVVLRNEPRDSGALAVFDANGVEVLVRPHAIYAANAVEEAIGHWSRSHPAFPQANNR
jgi:cation diffusion facilitator family transporter